MVTALAAHRNNRQCYYETGAKYYEAFARRFDYSLGFSL